MAENKLTERRLRNAVPKKEEEGYLPDGGGLTGRVMPARPGVEKKIVFQYRFKIDSKTGYFHCGTYPQTSLKEARDKRNAARKLVLDGIHPAHHERKERTQKAKTEQAERMEKTVTQLFETWENLYLSKHRKDGGALVRQFVNSDVLPKIGTMRAKDVTTSHIVDLVIEPILRRKRRRKANAVLSLLKQMFGYGKARGTLDSDPTAGLTRTHAGGEEPPRKRNLSSAEIAELSKAIHEAGLPKRLIAAVWLLLATGARTKELLHARFDEFNLNDNTWAIPEERTKNGKPHLVHLSPFARRWIDELIELKGGAFLFPGRKEDEPVHEKGLSKSLRDRQIKKRQKGRTTKPGSLLLSGGTWTAHDLRRTLASRMGDLNIPPHVIEKCLNHSLGGLLAVYQHQEYLPERKAAFEVWGASLDLLTAAKNANLKPAVQQDKSKTRRAARRA
jgi:integrase